MPVMPTFRDLLPVAWEECALHICMPSHTDEALNVHCSTAVTDHSSTVVCAVVVRMTSVDGAEL